VRLARPTRVEAIIRLSGAPPATVAFPRGVLPASQPPRPRSPCKLSRRAVTDQRASGCARCLKQRSACIVGHGPSSLSAPLSLFSLLPRLTPGRSSREPPAREASVLNSPACDPGAVLARATRPRGIRPIVLAAVSRPNQRIPSNSVPSFRPLVLRLPLVISFFRYAPLTLSATPNPRFLKRFGSCPWFTFARRSLRSHPGASDHESPRLRSMAQDF